MRIELSDQQCAQRPFDDIAELRDQVAILGVQREAHRWLIGVMSRLLSSRDPGFHRLFVSSVRGLKDHLIAQGLDDNDPLVKATIAEAESVLVEDAAPPARMHVIQGGNATAKQEQT